MKYKPHSYSYPYAHDKKNKKNTESMSFKKELKIVLSEKWVAAILSLIVACTNH